MIVRRRGFLFLLYGSGTPFTSVRVMLSTPGVYVPLNCATTAGWATMAGVLVAAVLDALMVVEAFAVPALAINGASAETTAAILEFTTGIFAPYVAVIT
jgi:hypothetical protein